MNRVRVRVRDAASKWKDLWWPRFFRGGRVRAIPNPNPNLLQAARLLLVAALHLDRLQQAAILRRQLELALVLERAHHDVLEGEEASGRLTLGLGLGFGLGLGLTLTL